MIPAQLPIPTSGSGLLVLGGGVFAVTLALVVVYMWVFVWDSGDPWEALYDDAADMVEDADADAIAFIPYSDGPLIPKPALYDRELLGGKGGYRTPDGERIYIDGQGNGTYSLGGVDVILAMDPTEHAAGVDPLKAYVAHENDTGRWLKVDREGELLEAGEALRALPGADGEDAPTPAMDIPKEQGVETAADGGTEYASRVHEHAHEHGMTLEDALAALESASDEVHKIVDLAPPRATHVDEDGEVQIEEATHVAVDVSEAANLLPKKTNTTAWQTMEEKARQEGRDEDKLREYITTGFVLGAVVGGGIGVVMALIFLFA
jgi:hypothetical protein